MKVHEHTYCRNPDLKNKYFDKKLHTQTMENQFDDGGELDGDMKIEYLTEEREDECDDNYKSIWLDAPIKLLLSLVEEIRPKIGKSMKFKSKNKMWQEIQRRLEEKGYIFTQKQIENKFGALERNYKKVKCHSNLTARNRIQCPYERELSDILGDKPAVVPEYLLGTKDNQIVQQHQQDVDYSSDDGLHSAHEDEPCMSSPTGKDSVQNTVISIDPKSKSFRKRKSSTDDVLSVTKTMLKEQRKHNAEVIKVLKSNHEAKLERNKILKNILDKL